jgi:hypothetical protein
MKFLDKTLNNDRIDKLLGGMSAVYQGNNLGPQRSVAIKLIHPGIASRPDLIMNSMKSELQKRTLIKAAYSIYLRLGTRGVLRHILDNYCGHPPTLVIRQRIFHRTPFGIGCRGLLVWTANISNR